ncbi:MAG TPA: malto-oligosyltrehalose synthase, partial [Bryobacteraceae bacterium]|nr:malto-oligosyltrehalose synthase [Bryobacteraceae bacterium]
LQFREDFGFAKAGELAPYLARLGVSHVYASPWLKARPGSSHGYDIVDHHSLNPELGDQAAFDYMVAALKVNGIGQILDFVPNHIGVGGSDNPMWLDVLEWGRDSAYSGWLDIDWQPGALYLRDKLLVPFLGDQYGVELYGGKLTLKFDEEEGSFAVWAYDTHKLPICPLHYGRILGDTHPELDRLGDAFGGLPEWRPQVVRRAGELKAELASSFRAREDVREAIATALRSFAGTPGEEESWRELNALIEQQHWRAAHFRVAADDINYRRFFDINDLAGLRMELPEVFDHAHSLVLRLLADGTLDGLRIDHVDGLLNPKEYFQRLRQAANRADEPFYFVVEKILATHESLREDWPVDGTTGYEFMNLVLGLLIDSAGEEGITRDYADFTGERKAFAEIVRECKLRIMRTEMASELNVLASEAARLAHQQPRSADFTYNVLRRALREIVACFPVYRTYLDTDNTPGNEDRRDLSWAMKQARARETEVDASVFDFVGGLLSGELVAKPHSGFSRQAVLRCAMKMQQYSGPVMAKGLEDTALYRYNRFIALNEVGGHPDQFGTSLANFHKASVQRAKRWPNSMVSTSTHDTKRGEDVRARLAVVSEMPEEWARQTRLWSRILRARRGDIEASAPPNSNDEYLFYQLLAGSWPMELTGVSALDPALLKEYAQRLKGAMTKAIREAKLHSTWSSPNSVYEGAVLAFIDGALDPDLSRAFFTAFLPFQERIARLGVQNSLVQTALKLTVPGVPDIYQGADLWDLNLVDPDNRRPVNYEPRIRLLDEIEGGICMKSLMERWRDGAVKLFLISKILNLRAAEPELFARGEYEPLYASGPKADLICAFARRHKERRLIVMVARFPTRMETDPCWDGTTIPVPQDLPQNGLHNVLTGKSLDVIHGVIEAESGFDGLPVAVLKNWPVSK